MRKLLVICGPTATGKTKLALHLAKIFNGEIISADSRQVYKKMDIGTGKDLPPGKKLQSCGFLKHIKYGFYKFGEIKVWGYDMVDPKDQFSVGDYLRFFNKIIKRIYLEKKLPILVGGTGLYIKAVVDGLETAFIPQNKSLRLRLEKKNKEELFEILSSLDPLKAASLNQSDRKNPRRLIRAIEVAQWMLEHRQLYKILTKPPKYDTLFIGLTTRKLLLNKIIQKRILKRAGEKMEKEVKELIKSGVSWNSQSMSALGYKIWKDFFWGKKNKKEIIKEWLAQEKSYAKRQIKWFKRDKRIKWFDISDKTWRENVENEVKKWYHTTR